MGREHEYKRHKRMFQILTRGSEPFFHEYIEKALTCWEFWSSVNSCEGPVLNPVISDVSSRGTLTGLFGVFLGELALAGDAFRLAGDGEPPVSLASLEKSFFNMTTGRASSIVQKLTILLCATGQQTTESCANMYSCNISVFFVSKQGTAWPGYRCRQCAQQPRAAHD